MINLKLGSNELRIIGHAINWLLNVPFEHTTAPQLSQQEIGVLNRNLIDIQRYNRVCLASGGLVTVEVGEPDISANGSMRLSTSDFRLLTDAVGSFFHELQTSPTEMEVVTGLPPSKTADLVSRLEATCQSTLSCAE